MPLFDFKMPESFHHEQARREGELAGRNRKLWETGKRAEWWGDVQPGYTVVPFDAFWMRGPGVVHCVDSMGMIGVDYGANPENPSSKPVRCVQHWSDTVVLGRSK